jgi:hypothetical protein
MYVSAARCTPVAVIKTLLVIVPQAIVDDLCKQKIPMKKYRAPQETMTHATALT